MDFRYFRHIEKEFLTREECVGFIEYGEQQGFEEAMIQTKSMGQVMDKNVRDNDRHIWDSRDLALQMWMLLQPHVPEEVDSWKPIGVNERFRIYRYKDGQQFNIHVDGSFNRNENEHSKISVLMYLNDDFSGGATEFVNPHELVVPETGMLLLFSHRQLHRGTPVIEGTKYVLRTDIMYSNK